MLVTCVGQLEDHTKVDYGHASIIYTGYLDQL